MDVSNNVMINATSGNSPLVGFLRDSSQKGMIGTAGGADSGVWGTAQDDMFIRSSNKNIFFSANSSATADMRVLSSGNVILGAFAQHPTPPFRLSVAGSALFGGSGPSGNYPRFTLGAAHGDYGVIGYNFYPDDANANKHHYLRCNDPASQLYFKNGNSLQFRRAGNVNGSSGAYTCSGDDTITFDTLFEINGANGNVGIGVTDPNPAYKLQVNGAAHFNGTVTATNIQAHFQDVAEWVPATEQLPAGTVVVLDARTANTVTASKVAYDSAVAGVVSPQPGISLGEAAPDKVLVATTGRVKVRVDATRGPVAIGDLLVTSNVGGTAMKSEPIEINGRKFHQPGTVVGKALEPLAKGTGEILVLLSLQ